ncbi:VOC family protein [Kitasatospora sp. McL0602]|uniref:VOC family protein n=1 Tax=Kitasatospora sp. McL0602 TaxID=3439530 RepID=UPI003F8AF1F3
MSTELAAIAVEALDVPALARFWAAALERRPVEHEGAVALPPQDPSGVGLLLVPSARPKRGKNRVHLDLAGDADEVRRLLGLGATRADIGQGAVPWEVLTDPEGNEFCVLPGVDTGDHLAAISLDSADPQIQGPFWATVTGWTVVAEGSWGVRLRSPAGTGPTLVMGPPVAPKRGRNRLQPVVEAAPGSSLAATVARLTSAGATEVPELGGTRREALFTDPEGNEFRLRGPER